MSVMYVGEGLVIEGSDLDNVAHIDLLIGPKDGPVGVAFANALANQSAGPHQPARGRLPEHHLQAGHGDDHQGDAQGRQAGDADVRPGPGGGGPRGGR